MIHTDDSDSAPSRNFRMFGCRVERSLRNAFLANGNNCLLSPWPWEDGDWDSNWKIETLLWSSYTTLTRLEMRLAPHLSKPRFWKRERVYPFYSRVEGPNWFTIVICHSISQGVSIYAGYSSWSRVWKCLGRGREYGRGQGREEIHARASLSLHYTDIEEWGRVERRRRRESWLWNDDSEESSFGLPLLTFRHA